MYIKECMVFSPTYDGRALSISHGEYPRIESICLTPDEEEELLNALLKRTPYDFYRCKNSACVDNGGGCVLVIPKGAEAPYSCTNPMNDDVDPNWIQIEGAL